MERVLKSGELAIIIPVLNCVDYSKKMIPTIKTRHPYKLILINNGSTDGTEAYFHELSSEANTLVVNYKENRGVAPAWNSGIRRAILDFNSRYFLIPNNDVLLHPQAIDILVEAIQAPRVALATATDVSGKVAKPEDTLNLTVPMKNIFTDCPDFSCFMLKKETINRIGYFDPKFYPAYFEDNDYHYRIKLQGLRGVKTNRALFFHYGSRTMKDNAGVKEVVNLGYNANKEYYKRKWGGYPGEEKFHKPFGGQQ